MDDPRRLVDMPGILELSIEELRAYIDDRLSDELVIRDLHAPAPIADILRSATRDRLQAVIATHQGAAPDA